MVLYNVEVLYSDESHDKDAVIHLMLLSSYSSLRCSWSSDTHSKISSPLFCLGHHLQTTLTHLGQPFALDCSGWSLRLGKTFYFCLSMGRWVCYYYEWLPIAVKASAWEWYNFSTGKLCNLFSEIVHMYVEAETSSLSPGTRASRRYIHMAGWSRWCCVMEIQETVFRN